MERKLPNNKYDKYFFRLKELRKDNKLTQNEVANEIGFSIKTYRSWENRLKEEDTPDISMKGLKSLSDLFGVSTDYIFRISDFKGSIDNEKIYKVTGLSNDSIEVLKMWKNYKDDPEDFIPGYGVRDIDTLNLLLEDWYSLHKKADKEGHFAQFSIFSFISRYLFSDKFKRKDTNLKGIHIYNTELPEEDYNVSFADMLEAHNRNNIMIIIDRIKVRVSKQ